MNHVIDNLEVQDALQVLSKYGLGAVQIHMHNEEGGMVPLKEGIVQLEQNLKVSFVSENSPELKNSEPVAWSYQDGEIKAISYCGSC